MTDEQLKSMWHSTIAPAKLQAEGSQLNREMNDKLLKFDRTIRARDIRENLSAVIVIIFFSVAVFKAGPMVSKIASVIVIAWAALTIYITMSVKRYRVKDASLPLLQYLKQYRLYIAKEKYLLDTVLWWYILPAYICIVLFSIGYHNWITIIGGTAMAIFIYWLNKYAAREYFKPLLQKLDEEINNLEE